MYAEIAEISPLAIALFLKTESTLAFLSASVPFFPHLLYMILGTVFASKFTLAHGARFVNNQAPIDVPVTMSANFVCG